MSYVTECVDTPRSAPSLQGARAFVSGYFRATEITDDDKPPVLRAYLKKWKWEVGVFFDGVDAKASDETLRGIAPGYPIFRIEPATVTR